MSAAIYYFSGTGNAYRVAKTVWAGLEHAKVINMAQQQSREDGYSNNVIGIVFPLYYFGLPVLVEEFLQQLDIPQFAYVFVIVTRGVTPAGGAKRQLDAVFDAKGRTYHFFRYITMGNNFPFHFFNGSKENVKEKRNQKADEKIATILSSIKMKRQSRVFSILDYPPFPAITFGMPTFGYQHFLQIYDQDSCFVVHETHCNMCKKCERVCPVDNIEIHSTIAWKHKSCQMCLACYNCCPKNAIQYIDLQHKVNTNGKRQYWNFT